MRLKHKIVALGMVVLMSSQSLQQINDHTYSTGISNFHEIEFQGCFFGGIPGHFMYECGETFHIN